MHKNGYNNRMDKDVFSNMFALSGKKTAEAWGRFMDEISRNPNVWLEKIQSAQEKQVEIAAQISKNDEPVVSPPKNDRRFSDEKWRNNPFFSFLMQNYLVNAEMIRNAVKQADIDEKDKSLLLFSLEQYINAMSPTNFPATNPEVIDNTVKSGGENFIVGMQNFMSDMQQGMVSNTDTNAFSIGKDIATTKGKIVTQTPLMQLIEYAPTTPKVFTRPILIVPPCINKYYILDLSDKKSFVRHLVAAGHRVFLISWVNADEKHLQYNWDDYLREGVFAALEAVSAITRQDKINTLGFCIGGTLLASGLAILAAQNEKPAASLTLLASLLDFSDVGEIGLFVDEEAVAARESYFTDGGLMDGRELTRGFASLRVNDLVWPYVVNNYYMGKQAPPFDLLFWNADTTNLPGRMFTEYMRTCYLENQIAHNKARMCDTDVRLSTIKIPAYAIACEKDHIVPWESAYKSAKLLGGKTRFVLAASGHIAGIINPPSAAKGWHLTTPATSTALPTTTDKWRKTTKKAEGSWWNNWLTWLAKHSGKQISAPKKFGNARHAPIEDAPGAYVCAPLASAQEINTRHLSAGNMEK